MFCLHVCVCCLKFVNHTSGLDDWRDFKVPNMCVFFSIYIFFTNSESFVKQLICLRIVPALKCDTALWQ